MFNTTFVLLNPDFGFVAIDGQFVEYKGFDLANATFIHCTTPEEVEHVQSLDKKVLSFLADEVEAFPFGAEVIEAKDLKI